MAFQRVSIVIPRVSERTELLECVRALVEQNASVEIEIIIADRAHDESVRTVQQQFSEVLVLHCESSESIPALRYHGISKATGDIICVIAEHTIVTPDWLKTVVRAHKDEVDGVGGPIIAFGRKTLVEQAVFLLEYADIAPPMSAHKVDRLPGTNASYKKEALDGVNAETLRTCWEFFIHEEMTIRGAKFLMDPNMLSVHKKTYRFSYFFSQRFHLSRSFAAIRQARSSRVNRIRNILLIPLVGPLMFVRVLSRVTNRSELFFSFIVSMPILLLFLASYVAGEAVGYTLGPGDSLRRVE